MLRDIGEALPFLVIPAAVVVVVIGMIVNWPRDKSLQELQDERYRYEHREKKADEERQLHEAVRRAVTVEEEREKDRRRRGW